METARIISIAAAAICLIWALLFGILGGEGYLKWLLRAYDTGKFDLKKFKATHLAFLLLMAASFLIAGFCEKSYLAYIVIFIAIIGQQVLFEKVCRKH